MAHGFKSGGRKAGSKNKRTVELEQATQDVAAKVSEILGLSAFEGDAHAFLMLVYKNEKVPIDIRLDAAKAAAPYEKPRLSNIESKSESIVRYVARVPDKKADAKTWQEQHSPGAVGTIQ